MSLTAAALRRVAVMAQAAAVAGLAAYLSLAAGWPWLPALTLALLAVLIGFGISVAIAFGATLSGFGIPPSARPPLPADAPPRRRLNPLRALTCFLYECQSVFRMFNWLQPFRSRLTFVQPAHPRAGAPHVLLVHGYGCNHAIWLDLTPTLARAGYCCEAIDLEPVLGDIDTYAPQLLARMHAITARTGRAPLLVCHSMGGLAARAAQVLATQSDRTERAPPCAGIVTLGTPHHGCALARFGQGRNAWQMRWNSPWLAALANAETPSMRSRLVSIFSWHDSIAGPPGTSWLDGAHHLALEGIGHVSLLRHRHAIDATLAALAMLATQPTASPQTVPHQPN